MIGLEELKNRPLEVRILGFEETLPQAIAVYCELLRGKLMTMDEIKKARNLAVGPFQYLRRMEKQGIVTRVLIGGVLYFGLTEDIKTLGES